jgi:hypothetical protein
VSSITLGQRAGAKVEVLVPGNQDEGPLWKTFEGIDARDVVFSTTLPPEATAIEAVGKQLFVNPNAMMLMAITAENTEATPPTEAPAKTTAARKPASKPAAAKPAAKRPTVRKRK